MKKREKVFKQKKSYVRMGDVFKKEKKLGE